MRLHRIMTRAAGMFVVFFAMIATSAATQDYVIRPGDRLDIAVLEDPSLNRTVLVRPDGKVSLPLAGTLVAEGRTPEALQAQIRDALARDFVERPTVTVSLSALGTASLEADTGTLIAVYVMGQVGAPGRYDVESSADMLQALAIAGGPSVFAAKQRIQLRRRQGGQDRLFLFDYAAIEDGVVPLPPLALRDGDVIVVPERGLFE